MKEYDRDFDARIAEEAAHWVAIMTTTKPNRACKAAFRRWARSPQCNAEFRIAYLLYRALQRVDRPKAIDTRSLVGEALADSVVPFRTPKSAALHSTPSARPGVPELASDCALSVAPAKHSCRRSLGRGFATAATLICAIAFPSNPQGLHVDRWQTGTADVRTVRLLDGSEVVLNTNSSIQITEGGSSVTVHLINGEAFFNVRHDPKRIFWVLLNNALIEDLGTRFDVTRNTDESSTISVLDGSVRIDKTLRPRASDPFSVPREPTRLVVGKGEVIEIPDRSESNVLQVNRRDIAEIERQTAWADGWLAFEGDTLSDVVKWMNRYNRRQLAIVDPAIADLRVGGRFRARDLDVALSALLAVYPIRVLPSDRGNDVILLAGRDSGMTPDGKR